jgi:hypothetical protein
LRHDTHCNAPWGLWRARYPHNWGSSKREPGSTNLTVATSHQVDMEILGGHSCWQSWSRPLYLSCFAVPSQASFVTTATVVHGGDNDRSFLMVRFW